MADSAIKSFMASKLPAEVQTMMEERGKLCYDYVNKKIAKLCYDSNLHLMVLMATTLGLPSPATNFPL